LTKNFIPGIEARPLISALDLQLSQVSTIEFCCCNFAGIYKKVDSIVVYQGNSEQHAAAAVSIPTPRYHTARIDY
jgi:hypothetical protein